MKTQKAILISSLLAVASCFPASYQKVSFVVGAHNLKPKSSTQLPRRYASHSRNSRSFGFSFPFSEFWPIEETVFLPPSYPPTGISIFDVSYERGHVTPDFSNGLGKEYPDPLLLQGKDALIAVKYLYGRGELFYHQIPHIRALLRNQEERRRNGLDGNYLGSNRPGSPFYRQ